MTRSRLAGSQEGRDERMDAKLALVKLAAR